MADVVEPEIEGSAALIRQALGFLKVPAEKASTFLLQFRGMLELSQQESAAALLQSRELVLGSGAACGTIGQERIRERFGVTILTLERKDRTSIANPPATTRLLDGDRVRVFGLPEQIRSFEVWLSQTERAPSPP